MTIAAPNSRYLTNRLLADGCARGLSIVEIGGDGSVSYKPFIAEIHSTMWTDGVIMVIKASEVSEFLLSDIEMMLSRRKPLADINDYLKSSELYPQPGDQAIALIF